METCWFYDILFLGISGLLPHLLLFWPAGFLTDRLPKRYILILSAFTNFLILGTGFYFLTCLNHFSREFLLIILLLQSGVKVFYSPALYAMLPEIFEEEKLQKANGWIRSITFSASGLGILYATLMFTIDGGKIKEFAAGILIFSLIGIWRAFRIQPVISMIQQKKELLYSYRKTLKRSCRELLGNPAHILMALGENLFLSFGITILLLLLPFCQQQAPDRITQNFLFLISSAWLGIIIGTLLAGIAGIKKVELGLVPFGAAGVALSLLLVAHCKNFVLLYTPGFPFGQYLSINPAAMFWLFIAGCSGGLFIVPLQSYLQLRFSPEARGCTLALNDLFLQLIMTVSNIAVCLLGYRFFMETLKKDIPADITLNLQYIPQISPGNLIFILGMILLLVTLFCMWLLPDFCLRFISITLGHTFYRIQKQGTEHIPVTGPAILLSNHIS